jgi:hypothetical protein
VLDVGNVAPSDHDLAQCIGSPALDYFEVCRAHLHRRAAELFAPGEARQAWLAQATQYLTEIYRLAEEFFPEQLDTALNYFTTRTVFLHPTVQ